MPTFLFVKVGRYFFDYRIAIFRVHNSYVAPGYIAWTRLVVPILK